MSAEKDSRLLEMILALERLLMAADPKSFGGDDNDGSLAAVSA